ncbi:serine/threonine-protein kinase [Streptomyces sparsus]
MRTNRSGLPVRPARPGDPVRIGPYRIIGLLGSGGMGTVHAGVDPAGARAAVKVVHSAQAEDPEFRARFRREVQLSSRVQGPCLLPLLAADPEADTPWLATVYAPGPTLNQHLADRGPLSGGTLYAFAAGTAQALAAIHRAGVIHRDVKPQNVILAPAGPRVLDFGIAHAAGGTSVTRTGVMTGTPGWISPEQYRTGATTPESDMFAWGALVAHAATGRLPFGAGAPDVVAFRVLSGEPDLDGVPEDLRRTVRRALAKDAAERMSAHAAADECVRLLSSQTTQVLSETAEPEPTLVGHLLESAWDMPALADPSWGTPPSPSRSRTVLSTLGTAAVIGAVAGIALSVPGSSRSVGARDVAAVSPGSSAQQVGPTAPAGPPGTPSADPGQARTDTSPPEVPGPAYTRAADESQPHPDEWRASTNAGSEDERSSETTIGSDTRAILGTKDMDFMRPTVTFNEQAQTVMVTGGPVPTLTDDYKEVFRRAADMAACTALSHRLRNSPHTWPYGRYQIHWKDFDGQLDPTILGYGQAAASCHHEIAGQWHGDEAGLATAGHPSTDRTEIRVADTTARSATASWTARVAEGYGLEHLTGGESLRLGFDPVEKAAYVWAYDGDGALLGRAQRAHFQQVVSKALCTGLLDERRDNPDWPYTRWSIALYQGNGAIPEIIASGRCAS